MDLEKKTESIGAWKIDKNLVMAFRGLNGKTTALSGYEENENTVELAKVTEEKTERIIVSKKYLKLILKLISSDKEGESVIIYAKTDFPLRFKTNSIEIILAQRLDE